jgi:Fuc2NAc and GlcNAc transferase
VTDSLAWVTWFTAAVVVAAAVTGRIIRWAEARGVVDRPNHRSSHTRTTARGGGLAIVSITMLAAVVASLRDPAAVPRLAGALVPAVGVALVSWIDDVRMLPNWIRFSSHVLGAAAATAALGPISVVDLGSFGSLDLGTAAWPLTILWIVGLTNACNFMDGVDGIAGITALTAGGGLAAAAGAAGAPAVAALALGLAAASAGFLWWNWQPARIFMGDVGSAFCGFLLAVLPMAMPPEFVPVAVPIAVLTMWPFVFDTLFTLGRRLWRGENVFRAHRSHLYQRLVISGWSHRRVASLYGLLAATGAGLALALLAAPTTAPVIEPVVVAFIPLTAASLLVLTALAERCLPSTTAS